MKALLLLVDNLLVISFMHEVSVVHELENNFDSISAIWVLLRNKLMRHSGLWFYLENNVGATGAMNE